MAEKTIGIDQLRVGMYVIGMDISWMKTPFLVHRLEIREPAHIAALRRSGAREVTIDTQRGKDVEPEPSMEAQAAPPLKIIQATSYQKELDQAKKIRSTTRKAMQKAFTLIQQDEELKESMLTPVIDQTVESLLRNSSALLSLAHQRNNGMYLINHCFNVMTLSLLMGQQLDFKDQALETLGMAGLLMDIGWIKLPLEQFMLGYSYTDEEYEAIRLHVDQGVSILEANHFSPEVVSLVEHHHERFDGSGYPSHIAGEQIPIASRILSLVDHFDSLVNGYYDSPSVIPAKALKIIYNRAQQGGHDLNLVQLLIHLVGVYPMSSAVLLNTGERGVVTRVNWKTPLMPRVKVFYNRAKSPLTKPYEVDLEKQFGHQETRAIEKIIDPGVKQEDPLGILHFDAE